ncbi:MAG: SusC/RagA family TonB-linked outer membrane protein [Gemmatimonadaceae bacterium]
MQCTIAKNLAGLAALRPIRGDGRGGVAQVKQCVRQAREKPNERRTPQAGEHSMGVIRCLSAAILAALVLEQPLSAQGNTGRIDGRVTDSTSQQPLSNVTISVPGTSLGALSRGDGSFSLVGVPAGSQRLHARRIGYALQERTVTVTAGQTAQIAFALNAVPVNLSAVVVTGYGAQRREAITGSVATVDADVANVGVVANANELIQGRIAGVNMVQSNGEPGGDVQIRVRGGTSISASNSPLYVVDGVPLQNEVTVAAAPGVANINPALARNPLNSINPNDIESITVLKDASATAIYGSRGANGVILIATKRGSARAGGMEYDAYVSAASPSSKLEFLTGSQYRAFVQQQVTAGKLAQKSLTDLGSANTDWEEALTRTGYATNHNVAFSGGSASTKYRASLNYFEQQGVVISNALRRYQGRLNGLHEAFSGRLSLSLNMTASRVNNDFVPFENTGGFEGGIFTNMAIFNPTHPVTVRDSATGGSKFFEIGPGAQSVRNPVAIAEQVLDFAPENRVLGNVTGTVTIMPTLTAQTTVGVDYTSAVRRTYFPRENAVGAQFNGLARQAERSLQNLNFQQLLTWTPRILENHELDIVGGYEYSEFENVGFEVEARGFITDAFRWNNLGAGTQASSPPPVSYNNESKLVSFFSRANYGIADKYFFTGVVRYDGSSRLAEGNKWSIFPAFSASWHLHKEGFWSDKPLGLSALSVRAGWGMQGNQAVREYGTQLLLRANNAARYPFGTGITTGLLATQVANPDLKWEISEQINVGVDYGFRDDRITGTIEIYQKTTDDLLLEVSVPQPAVVATRLENIGSLRNRGIEMSVEGTVLSEGSKFLSAGLVATIERNKVLSLGGDREFIGTGNVSGQGQSGQLAQRIIVGEPIGTFWGPVFRRVDNAGKQVFRCVKQRTECVNGETTLPISDDDQIIGNANPDVSLGLNSSGRWGKVDASWFWRAEMGRDVFNNTALVYQTKSNVLQGRNFLAAALSDADSVGQPAIYSSRWIEDGSFIRLQNVTIGYTFDLPARFQAIRSTRVYVSGDNLFLLSDYSGYDPEVFVGAGLASRGIDYLTYPRARTFTTGVRFTF